MSQIFTSSTNSSLSSFLGVTSPGPGLSKGPKCLARWKAISRPEKTSTALMPTFRVRLSPTLTDQLQKYGILSDELQFVVMAFTTYILLSGAVAGSKGRFDPELLSISASQGMHKASKSTFHLPRHIWVSSSFRLGSLGHHLFGILLHQARLLPPQHQWRWRGGRPGGLLRLQVCRVRFAIAISLSPCFWRIIQACSNQS